MALQSLYQLCRGCHRGLKSPTHIRKMSWRAHAKEAAQLEGREHALKTKALLMADSALAGVFSLGICGDIVHNFLTAGGSRNVLLVPYALADSSRQCENMGALQFGESRQFFSTKARLAELGFECTSIHHSPDPVAAVKDAQVIFIGGGNSFWLLRKLHSIPGLVPIIQHRVRAGDLRIITSSCGSACSGPSIHTSTCMPICEVPSFQALGIVPFNISPHYQDFKSISSGGAELGLLSREESIRQYTDGEEGAVPVVGLREGSLLEVDGGEGKIRLHGTAARVFWPNLSAEEFQPGSRMDVLLKLGEYHMGP